MLWDGGICGEAGGDVRGDASGKDSASRMMRMERTMFNCITERHKMRSSRNAVGVYKR
jgi:hypothetical protein